MDWIGKMGHESQTRQLIAATNRKHYFKLEDISMPKCSNCPYYMGAQCHRYPATEQPIYKSGYQRIMTMPEEEVCGEHPNFLKWIEQEKVKQDD